MSDSTPGIPAFATLADDPEIAPLLDFQPVVRKVKRPDGWTDALQRELIARIAATGTVQQAVWQMGKHATGAEALYKTPSAESFREAWDAAIAIGRRRNGLDCAPPFAGDVPGIQRRGSKSSPAAEGRGRGGADDSPALSDEQKWAFMLSIGQRFMRKVAAEREARLAGEIVAADFYLRQVTFLEVLLDLGAEAMGWDAHEVLRELRRGEFKLLEIVSTPLADWMDRSRRLWWQREGEPDRPPHPDVRFLERHPTPAGEVSLYADQHAYGALTAPARGYTKEQWAKMSIDEQRAARQTQFDQDAAEQVEYERRAVAEHEAQSRSADSPGES